MTSKFTLSDFAFLCLLAGMILLGTFATKAAHLREKARSGQPREVTPAFRTDPRDIPPRPFATPKPATFL